MSSEKREFRPFQVDDKLARAFDETSLHFGDLSCRAGGNLLIEDRTFSQRSGSIAWAEEDDFEEFKRDLRGGSLDSGLDPSLLSLVVVVRSAYLKAHEVVHRSSIADIDRLARITQITTTEDRIRWIPFFADTHGAFVEAYVTLSKQLKPSPMRAWRKSTWLSKAVFRVRCEADNVLFRPQPLDEDERRRLNLLKETVFFVEFDSGCELTADLSETEVPILWVDSELLTVLDQHRASPTASLIQRQMALHLITGVLYEFARQAAGQGPEDSAAELDTLTFDQLSGSMVGRINRMISGPRATPGQRDELLNKMRSDPRTVAAWAENRVDLCSSFKKDLRDST